MRGFVWFACVTFLVLAAVLLMAQVTAPAGQPLLEVEELLGILSYVAILVGGFIGFCALQLAARVIRHHPASPALDFVNAVQWWVFLAFGLGALGTALVGSVMVVSKPWQAVNGATMLGHLALTARFLGTIVVGGLSALLVYALGSRAKRWGGSYAIVPRGKGA